MARIAERIHTLPADIARIEALIVQLSDGDRVELLLDDGSTLDGIVAGRPSVQVFLDGDGNEGINAVLRLEQPALDAPMTAGWRDLWVDTIREVRHCNPP